MVLDSAGRLLEVFFEISHLITKYDLEFSYEVSGTVFVSSVESVSWFVTTLSIWNSFNANCGDTFPLA